MRSTVGMKVRQVERPSANIIHKVSILTKSCESHSPNDGVVARTQWRGFRCLVRTLIDIKVHLLGARLAINKRRMSIVAKFGESHS